MTRAFWTHALAWPLLRRGPGHLLLLAWLWAAVMLLSLYENHSDETNQLAQAWRVAQGERLYQEVWEFAAPLPILLVSACYRVLGPGLDVARALAAVFLAITMVAVWRLALALGARPWGAAVGGALVALGALPAYRTYYHHWLAWAWVLVAWCLALWVASRPKGPWWAWLGVGLLVGVASMCTWTAGAVGGGSLAAWLLLPKGDRLGAWWEGARALGMVAAGTVLLWLLVTLGFAAQGGAGVLWSQSLLWPFLHYRSPGGANDIRPLSDLALAFPFDPEPGRYLRWLVSTLARLVMASLHAVGALLAVLVLGAMALQALGQGHWPSLRDSRWMLLGLGAIGAALGAWSGRADVVHLVMASLPSLVVLSACAGHLLGTPELRRGLGFPARVVGHVPQMLWAGLLVLCTAAELRQASSQAKLGQWQLGLDRAFRATQLVQEVQRWLPPGGRVQAFLSNGPVFLFTQARPATSFGLLTPLSFRYHGPEDYARFRREWATTPPDLVLVGPPWTGESAVAEWGGQPTLEAYRWVGTVSGWGACRLYLRTQAAAPPHWPRGPQHTR